MKDMKDGVVESIQEMRAMEHEGYDARQIGLKLIVPHMGRKVSSKALSKKLTLRQKTQQRLKQNLMKKRAAARAKSLKGQQLAKPEDEAAEAEPPWQDQYVQKTFRVVREFEGGQEAYGFVGLCVQASCFEANERSLLLVGSDHKENVSWH